MTQKFSCGDIVYIPMPKRVHKVYIGKNVISYGIKDKDGKIRYIKEKYVWETQEQAEEAIKRKIWQPTEQDKDLVVRLWNNRMSIECIVRMLPYEPTVARQYIQEVKESGALKEENRVPIDRDLVVQTWQSGMKNPHEIAETFDINYNCVQTYLKDAKLQRKRPSRNYKKRNAPERRQQIITAINDGKSNAEIAREFGVTRQWVFYIRKKYVDISENKGE